MPYCPECGSEVGEDMTFCPECGISLKAEKPASEVEPSHPCREEKEEKEEKREKGEKREKHEKRPVGFMGPLIGGLILIVLGLIFLLRVTGLLRGEAAWALFLIFIGSIIVIGAIYAAKRAAKRHPKP